MAELRNNNIIQSKHKAAVKSFIFRHNNRVWSHRSRALSTFDHYKVKWCWFDTAWIVLWNGCSPLYASFCLIFSFILFSGSMKGISIHQAHFPYENSWISISHPTMMKINKVMNRSKLVISIKTRVWFWLLLMRSFKFQFKSL